MLNFLFSNLTASSAGHLGTWSHKQGCLRLVERERASCIWLVPFDHAPPMLSATPIGNSMSVPVFTITIIWNFIVNWNRSVRTTDSREPTWKQPLVASNMGRDARQRTPKATGDVMGTILRTHIFLVTNSCTFLLVFSLAGLPCDGFYRHWSRLKQALCSVATTGLCVLYFLGWQFTCNHLCSILKHAVYFDSLAVAK